MIKSGLIQRTHSDSASSAASPPPKIWSISSALKRRKQSSVGTKLKKGWKALEMCWDRMDGAAVEEGRSRLVHGTEAALRDRSSCGCPLHFSFPSAREGSLTKFDLLCWNLTFALRGQANVDELVQSQFDDWWGIKRTTVLPCHSTGRRWRRRSSST